eukprot:CFRG0136T1
MLIACSMNHAVHLSSLQKEKRDELNDLRGGMDSGSKTISCLTGDFLMPYLLSTIDKGKGMMKMLNITPIDYLIWGNHEADLSHKHLMKREKEYGGVWINSNMQSHESFSQSECQTEKAVIQVTSADGTNVRNVGMIGVLSNTESLYATNAFNGAKIEDPWEIISKYKQILEEEDKCDIVVPLCHLYEPQDERTCREFDFPVILSGHDHHVVDKVIDGTRLLKPGANGIHAIVLDITWDNADSKDARIDASIVKVSDWEPDPQTESVVQKALTPLKSLRSTELTVVPEKFKPLNAMGARERRVSCGTYICSQFRDALNLDSSTDKPNCDCSIIKGSSAPRSGKVYPEDQCITLEFLLSEIDETDEVIIVEIPGSVLRAGLRETWTEPNPGWMQYDDGIEVDNDGYIVAIAGKPLAEDRLYRVGTVPYTLVASDAPTIGGYFNADESRMPDKDKGQPAHTLLMKFWAEIVWLKLFEYLDKDSGGTIDVEEMKALDTNNDGYLDKTELLVALHTTCGFSTDKNQTSFVEMILDIAGDFDGDGRISRAEINEMYGRKTREHQYIKSVSPLP